MSEDPKLPQSISDEGADAFLRGLSRENCPYPPGAAERLEWLTGWDRAATDLR